MPHYEIGGKTGTADQPKDGLYSEAKINTFASIFPTSNPTIVNDPSDGRLRLYFRGFEGLLYESHQLTPGNGSRYSTPHLVSSVIIE